MCDINHQREPRAGYLVHVGPESIAAPGALLFEHGSRGRELLSDEQIATANRIYHAEKDTCLAALADSLANAVGPTFDFVKA